MAAGLWGEGPSAEARGRAAAGSGLAGRPELVFGAYRVPDHIGSSLTAGRRYVEWHVVHAATQPLAPATAPVVTHPDDTARWVARASGEPSVLDEELGIAVLAAAGVGPERCSGVARSIGSISGGGGDENSSGHGYVMIHVGGVDLFHPADVPVEAQPRYLAAPGGVHFEVLNWRAIDKAVRTGAPASQRRPVTVLVPPRAPRRSCWPPTSTSSA